MALHAVHHVAILVSDYQASRHFYVDLLGFTVLRENFRPEKNDWKLDLILDGVELEIFSASAAPPRPDRPEALGLRRRRWGCGIWPSGWRMWSGRPRPWVPKASPPSPSGWTPIPKSGLPFSGTRMACRWNCMNKTESACTTRSLFFKK